MTSWLLLFALAMSITSCREWVSVNPTSADRLSPGSSATAADVNGTVVVSSVITVETPDGTLKQIEGTYELRLTRTSGEVTLFEHPVSVERKGGALVIRSANRSATEVPFSEIQKVEVAPPVAVAGVFALGLGTALALVFLLAQ